MTNPQLTELTDILTKMLLENPEFTKEECVQELRRKVIRRMKQVARGRDVTASIKKFEDTLQIVAGQ